MIAVGVRELKAHLSYYLKRMQEGEEIAIRMRNTVVGYLSHVRLQRQKSSAKRHSTHDLEQLVEVWKKEGFLLSGKVGKWRPHRPTRMTPGISGTEMIRKMRDEDWR